MSTAATIAIILILAIIAVLLYILVRIAKVMREGVCATWGEDEIRNFVQRHGDAVKAEVIDGLRRHKYPIHGPAGADWRER